MTVHAYVYIYVWSMDYSWVWPHSFDEVSSELI